MREQSKLKKIGESGCYFLSLLEKADKMDQVIFFYDLFTRKNWMRSDCYMNCPKECLEVLTNKRLKCYKSKEYNPKAYLVLGYFTYKGNGHFVIMKDKNTVEWDSFGESNTVKYGKLDSYRIFEELEEIEE